ncbi:spore germination protein [Shimazuella sp. AN120528]|uniref:GerAB/ArcD/ProY family transporter n=1 Tax=Shimazuella soli TaxID=1892854 RepID=UPI001F0F0A31|nr:endospore germination permease [Shimazuella soli]MCH5585503.1 spore germination protein [Shimazuella soli]
MLNQQQIGIRQFFILVFLFTIGTSIIVGPRLATLTAYQDGWISAILGLLMGTVLIWIYTTLGKHFLEKTLVEILQLVLGKWIGSIVSFCFVVFLVILSSVVLMNIGHFISSRILVYTPIVPIEYMFIALVVFGNILGIEVLARAAESLLPLFLILFGLFTIGLLPLIEVNNIKPILENGIYPVWESSIRYMIVVFGELFVFFMIIPYINKSKEQHKKIKRYFLSGAIFGGIIILITVLFSILILGPKAAIWTTYPAYALAKKIDFAGVFQRVEVIMAGIWFISIFFKLSILMHVITSSVKQIFHLKDRSVVSIPFGMLLIPISLWFTPNVATYLTTVTHLMGLLILIFMLLPILVMGVGWIRLRFLKKSV